METIDDLYVFAARYGLSMKDALETAGLGPNWAHRQRKGKRTDPVKLRRLRDVLIAMGEKLGEYRPGAISQEVSTIREALNRIEAAAGAEK